MDKKGQMLLMSTLGAAIIATAPMQVKAEDTVVDSAGQAMETTAEQQSTEDVSSAVSVAEQSMQQGWTTDNEGNVLYVNENGNYVRGKLKEIDGKRYYFDWNGYLCKSQQLYLNTYETGYDVSGYYYASEDGSLVTDTWITDKYGHQCYYTDNGMAPSGAFEVDGKTYYFMSGSLTKNQIVTTDDGSYYICDEEGVATKAENNQWTNVNGEYYYVKDNQLLKDCVEKIENNYYGFDAEGKLIVDQIFYRYETIDSNYVENCYYAKEDGSLYVNEWYIDEMDERYYFTSDGSAASGYYNVDGVNYYFSYFRVQEGRIITENNRCYVCASDGVATEAKNNAWTKVDGECYYVKDNKFLVNCVEKIGSHYYGFNYDGIMYKDQTFFFEEYGDDVYSRKYYRAKEDGSLYTNEWFTEEGRGKYYYGDNVSDGTLWEVQTALCFR